MVISRAVTLRPFYFSCVSVYVFSSISPSTISCVPLGYLVMSLIRSLGIHRESPMWFLVRYTVRSLWVPLTFPCIYCGFSRNKSFSPCVPRSFGDFSINFCFMFSYESLNGSPEPPCNVCRAFLVSCALDGSLYITLQVSCSFRFSFCVLCFSWPSTVHVGISNPRVRSPSDVSRESHMLLIVCVVCDPLPPYSCLVIPVHPVRCAGVPLCFPRGFCHPTFSVGYLCLSITTYVPSCIAL